MKKKLLCSLVLVVTMSMTLVSGCASKNGKDSLTKALTNTAEANSYENTTSVKFKIDGNEEAKAMNMSEFGLDMKSKVVGEKNKKQDMSSDISLNYGGVSIDTSLFLKGTYENNKLNSKITVSIPPILLSLIGSVGDSIGITSDTKYLVLDTKELETLVSKDLNPEEYKKSMEQVQVLMDSMKKAIEKYVTTTGKDSIVQNDNKEITSNGTKVKATVYNMKVTDKQFKSFIKGYVNDIVNDKDLLELFKASLPTTDQAFDVKTIITEFNAEFDKLPQIIGDKGLNVSIAVKDNYVIQQTFESDIIIPGSADGSDKKASLATVNVKLSTDTFNINGKDIKIDFPVTDKANSVNLMDIINGIK